MKHLLILIFAFICATTYAQVGIATTTPKATLDIVASNQATPTNNDGILIPRVDAFSATNPTIDQDAMIVYLSTTVGTDTPGFYYWNNATTTWLPFGGESTGWEILGNTGTVSGTNFLGTKDNQALDIRTNDVIRARFNTTGQLEILNAGGSVLIGENTGTTDDLANRQNVLIGKDVAPNVATGAAASYQGAYNVGLGTGTMRDLTSGYDNVAIGRSVMQQVTTASANVAIGTYAMRYAGNAENNVAIGYKASEEVTGSNNTAVGFFALGGEGGVATANTALGAFSASRNIDGYSNVTIGMYADQKNEDGFNNTIIGTKAGLDAPRNLASRSGRVFIGYNSGALDSGDNTLYIENSNSITPLIYGEFDNDILRVGGQLQIGSSDDATAGSIYAFPVVDGTSGQALVTDGSGNVSWGTVSGGGADTQDLSINNTTADLSLVDGGTVEIKTIADSDDNTLIQVEETANDDIIRFDIGGTERLRMVGGRFEVPNSGGSVLIGENTGITDDLVNRQNVLIGKDVATNVTTGASNAYHGANNVGLGNATLRDLTTGIGNVALGHNALQTNATSSNNVAIGRDAMQDAGNVRNSVAIGYAAADAMTGDANTAVGYLSMGWGGGTGTYNTGLGAYSGNRITNGSENVTIGANSDYWNNVGSNNTIIGAEAGFSTGSNRSASGRVMLGHSAGKLDNTDNKLYIENSNTTTPLIGGDFANDRLSVNTDISTLAHTFTVTGTAKITELMNLEPGTAPVTPAEGDIYYDSATKKVRVWTGAVWENLN